MSHVWDPATNCWKPITSGGGTPLPITEAEGYSCTFSFTPAAASHTGNDVNGGRQAATFSPAVPSGSTIKINSATLEIDGANAEATVWTLHLYNAAPPSNLADDAAFDIPSGDRAAYLISISLGTAVDQGATQQVSTHNLNAQLKMLDATLHAYLVNVTTLTPQNVAHRVELSFEVL